MSKEASAEGFPSANTLCEQAEALFKQERCEEGLACYERALALDSRGCAGHSLDDLLITIVSGETFLMNAERWIEYEPENAQAYFDKARALRTLRRPEEALAAYQQALELAPNNLTFTFEFGNLLMRYRRYEAALAVFQQMGKRQPDRASVHASCAWALGALERYEEALAACERALELAPELAFAWKIKSWILTSLQRPEEGLAALARALELYPDEAPTPPPPGEEPAEIHPYDRRLAALAFALNSHLYRTAHRPGEALQAIEYALERDPNRAAYHAEKACTLVYLKRFDEARAALEEALRLDASYIRFAAARRWPQLAPWLKSS